MADDELRTLDTEKYRRDIFSYKDYADKLSEVNKKSNELEKQRGSIHSRLGWIVLISDFILIGVFGFLVFALAHLIFSIEVSLALACISAMFSIPFLLDPFSTVQLNIVSLGEFNRIEKQLSKVKEQYWEVEKLKKDAREKLVPFESVVRNYYQTKLKDFLEENLYKKRSGGQQFEQSLSEFASMIEEVSKIDFITTYIPLYEYQDYLRKRASDHSTQTSKQSERVISTRNFISSFSSSHEQKRHENVAPENLYRIARKIDWEALNKQRKLTGTKGEEIAVAVEQEYFESIGRKDLADKIRHVSAEDGDGLGYDILSFFVDGREKYIEVKSTTTSLAIPLYLSRNELAFLKEHPDDAFIYRILVSGENSHIESQSSRHFLQVNDFVPVRYMARSK